MSECSLKFKLSNILQLLMSTVFCTEVGDRVNTRNFARSNPFALYKIIEFHTKLRDSDRIQSCTLDNSFPCLLYGVIM